MGLAALLFLIDDAGNAAQVIAYLASFLGSKKLLGAPGIATSSKYATRGSWPYY